LFLTGCNTNFYNNLTQGGRDFTAKLICDNGVTVESYTGILSDCQPVTEYCNCTLYADGESFGSFNGCIDTQELCNGATTLILTLDGDSPAIAYQCVDQCGDSITSLSGFLSNGDIPVAILDTEVSQEPFDLHLEY
jgi:hypothetical protein